MNVKKYLKELGLFNLFILIVCLLITIINYFSNFSYKVINLIQILFILITFVYFGFRAGKSADSKGYLAGLKVVGIEIIIMFLFGGIIFGFNFSLLKLAYYLVLIIGGVGASMVGINKKK